MANKIERTTELNDIYISKQMQYLLSQLKDAAKITITIPKILNQIVSQGQFDKLTLWEIRRLVEGILSELPDRTLRRYLPDDLKYKSKQRLKEFSGQMSANDDKNLIEESDKHAQKMPDKMLENNPTISSQNYDKNAIDNSYNIPDKIAKNNPDISTENVKNISENSSEVFDKKFQQDLDKKSEENPTNNLEKLVELILENPDKILAKLPTEMLENYLEIPTKINVEFPTKLLRNISISSDINLTALIDIKQHKILRIF